jgi:hypothetical protein
MPAHGWWRDLRAGAVGMHQPTMSGGIMPEPRIQDRLEARVSHLPPITVTSREASPHREQHRSSEEARPSHERGRFC